MLCYIKCKFRKLLAVAEVCRYFFTNGSEKAIKIALGPFGKSLLFFRILKC